MRLSLVALALAVTGTGCQDFDPRIPGGEGNDGSVDRDAAPNPPDGPLLDATPLELIDRGLVVRYFLDDATSGQDVTALADSAPNPLPLPVIFDGGMAFVENNGHHGLRWPLAGTAGRAEIGLTGTKILSALGSSFTGTIEVVVHIESTGSDLLPSRISHLGGNNPDFTLVAYSPDIIRFHSLGGNIAGVWTANPQPTERMVLHLVADSTQADPDARVTLYRNGVLMAKQGGTAPPQNQIFGLLGSDEHTLGNRPLNDRSFGGTLYYAALYSSALSSSEVDNNAMRLLATDDR